MLGLPGMAPLALKIPFDCWNGSPQKKFKKRALAMLAHHQGRRPENQNPTQLMKSQSNRTKADRKHASTENQASAGVANKNGRETETDGKFIYRKGAGHPARSTTAHAGIPTGVVAPDLCAAGEIETAEVLAAQGWKRLTLVMSSEVEGENWREEEILSDQAGGLWLQTEWHPKGLVAPKRAERKRITRAQACAILTKNSIPEAFQGDFLKCAAEPPDLETAIMKAQAFMMLMAGSECCHIHGYFVGERCRAFQAGINSMAIEIGDELAAGFHAMG